MKLVRIVLVYHRLIPYTNIGLQTIVPKKDISIQCSLLPAPRLVFNEALSSMPDLVDSGDLEREDEDTTEVEDSDTDYMTDVTDTVDW